MKIIKKLRLIYYLNSFFILILLSRIVFAQEVFKFFEFVPRNQEKISISKNTIEESFIPFNDFLSGFDLFLNNQKIRELDIAILDKNNQTFWQKKVGIPIINGGWWGQQYFITLGDNYQINSGEEYKLIIKENLGNSPIDIFVKNVLEILQGTESYLYFPENLKKLKIDGVETNYTLKLALYENKEVIPPIISNFRIEIINSQKAKVLFNSNEPIIYSFKYKGTLDLATSTFDINYFENCPYKIKDCQITLDVSPGRNYNFLLEAYDYWQNKTEKEGNFQVIETSTENFQVEVSATSETSFSQNQNISVESKKLLTSTLNQPSQTLVESPKSLNISQKLQLEKTSTEKLKSNKEKEASLTEIYSKEKKERNNHKEKEINNQKEKSLNQESNKQKKEIISENINITPTSSKTIRLLNFSQYQKFLKFFLFVILVFFISFIWLKKFKK